MKLKHLNPDGHPCYLSGGSCGPHQFVLHWSPAQPLALLTGAIFRWCQEGLLPFSLALKLIKHLEGEYLERRLQWLDEQIEDYDGD